ncbi:hypothetical protein CesoFtcFv8_010364 [Champsocephalus esox]|uniref:Uncharacterized protein n=1 Tax=Champsocephalus esox TaxID=159716 RepID=A0AAN8C5H5_9TELE|nr:hypothetical protein CesoFtcFv8_010364 [Champsocephalus esox]
MDDLPLTLRLVQPSVRQTLLPNQKTLPNPPERLIIVDYCAFTKLSCLVEIKGPRFCLPPCKPHHIRLAQWSPLPGATKAGLEEHATKNLCGAKLSHFRNLK